MRCSAILQAPKEALRSPSRSSGTRHVRHQQCHRDRLTRLLDDLDRRYAPRLPGRCWSKGPSSCPAPCRRHRPSGPGPPERPSARPLSSNTGKSSVTSFRWGAAAIGMRSAAPRRRASGRRGSPRARTGPPMARAGRGPDGPHDCATIWPSAPKSAQEKSSNSWITDELRRPDDGRPHFPHDGDQSLGHDFQGDRIERPMLPSSTSVRARDRMLVRACAPAGGSTVVAPLPRRSRAPRSRPRPVSGPGP